MNLVDDRAADMLGWLRATGRALPIPPASDVEAWEDVRATEAEWYEKGGTHPTLSRENQLAAVALLRDLDLVEITTGVHECDLTDDDPGVTVYVHLREP